MIHNCVRYYLKIVVNFSQKIEIGVHRFSCKICRYNFIICVLKYHTDYIVDIDYIYEEDRKIIGYFCLNIVIEN
jgi:hypothetical protein